MPNPRDILGRLGEFWETCCKVLGESWPDLEGMLALLPQGPGQLGFSGFPTRASWELFWIFSEAPQKIPGISRREPSREFRPGIRGMPARMPHCFGLTDDLFVKYQEFPWMVLGSSLGFLGIVRDRSSGHACANASLFWPYQCSFCEMPRISRDGPRKFFGCPGKYVGGDFLAFPR